LRSLFSTFVGASSDEIAITASVSSAVNAIAHAFDFSGPRNKILVSDFEFPTVGQIWHAQEQRGAQVVHIPDDGSEIPLERYEEMIDENTALVAVSHVCYRNGSLQNAKEIIRLAHAKGALVLLDSYQAMGSLPLNVKELDADILVGGSLKYMLGTAGVAFMYVREELLKTMWSTHTGWFAQEHIEKMDIHANSPSPTARRFEGGSPPVPNLYAAIAGIEMLNSVGMDKIRQHIIGLTDQLIAGVEDIGGSIATPKSVDQRGAMIAIRSTDQYGLVQYLDDNDIVTSCRDDNLRVSPHIYNDEDDIKRLITLLGERKDLLA